MLAAEKQRRHDQNGGGGQVDRHNLERRIFSHRPVLESPKRHQDQRRRRPPPFDPTRERKLESALNDRRPDNRPVQALFSGKNLLAQALRIGVGIHPAPVQRALPAQCNEPLRNLRGAPVALLVRSVNGSAARRKPFRPGRIVDLPDSLATVADLPLVAEARVIRPLAARIEAQDRLRLLHQSVSFSTHIARGHMEKLGSQSLRHSRHVLDPIDIGIEGIIDWREEVDTPGAIDDEADACRQSLQIRGSDPAAGTAHVASPDCDLLAKRDLASLSGDGLERRGSQRFGVKALLSREITRRSLQDVKVLEVRETIQDQPQHDLAQESIGPGQKDLVLLERLRDVGQEQL